MKKRALSYWYGLTPAGRVRLVLGVALAAVVLFLLFAPKPWTVEAPPGARSSVGYCVKVYSWWGGAIALAGLAALAATVRWWMHPLPPAVLQTAEAERASLARRTPRWFWPLVGAAMMVTAVAGYQRLGFSLWDDEIYNLRRFVQGDYRIRDDGTAEFRQKSWASTFQDYRKPNNHILHSALARLSVGGWHIFRDPAGPPFSEAAFRLPAFLFGIASVGALAWLLKELALARAGVLRGVSARLPPLAYPLRERGARVFDGALFPPRAARLLAAGHAHGPVAVVDRGGCGRIRAALHLSGDGLSHRRPESGHDRSSARAASAAGRALGAGRALAGQRGRGRLGLHLAFPAVCAATAALYV